jgi:hypothetical protein
MGLREGGELRLRSGADGKERMGLREGGNGNEGMGLRADGNGISP